MYLYPKRSAISEFTVQSNTKHQVTWYPPSKFGMVFCYHLDLMLQRLDITYTIYNHDFFTACWFTARWLVPLLNTISQLLRWGIGIPWQKAKAWILLMDVRHPTRPNIEWFEWFLCDKLWCFYNFDDEDVLVKEARIDDKKHWLSNKH